MSRIMILGGSVNQLPAIEKALEMGLEVVVCDMYDDAIGANLPGVIKETVSINDIPAVVEAAKKHKIDAITTICTDFAMRTVAAVCTEMGGLPGITEEAAYICTNKAEMRKCLKKNNVPIPLFYIVNNLEEYLIAVSNFRDKCKCVVKAVDNCSSRGITLLTDLTDLESVKGAYYYSLEYSRSGEVLVEEFMSGPEVCVETLNINGVCYPIQITDQLQKEPPFFTDAGYSQPSVLSENIKEKIKDVAVRANIALKNLNGSSCTEIIVTEDGPKVVEVGARLAGDFMATKLVPLSTGVDMVDGVIKIALGRYDEVDIQHKFNRGSCIRYFMKPVIGKIKEIRGVEEAAGMPGVDKVQVLKKVGDIAKELRESNDRLAYVIAHGNNAEEAVERCKNALNKLEIIVE